MRKLLSLIVFSIFSCIALANTADEIVELVLKNSPELKQYTLDFEAELLQYKTGNNIKALHAGISHKWKENGRKNFDMDITQGFDWPGLYSARSAAAKSLSQYQNAQLSAIATKLEKNTRQLLIKASAQIQRLALLEKVHDGMQELLKSARLEQSNGSITVIDLNIIELQAASVSANLSNAYIDLDDMLKELSLLAGTNIKKEMLPQEFPIDNLQPLDYYLDMINQSSPLVMEAQAKAEHARMQQRVAFRESFPGFSVSYKLERDEDIFINGVGIGIDIPVFSAKGKSAAAKMAMLAADHNVQTTINNLTQQVTTDYNSAVRLKNQVDAIGPVLNKYDNFKLLKRLFSDKQISLTGYISDVQFFINATMNYLNVRADYHTAILSLYTAFE